MHAWLVVPALVLGALWPLKQLGIGRTANKRAIHADVAQQGTSSTDAPGAAAGTLTHGTAGSTDSSAASSSALIAASSSSSISSLPQAAAQQDSKQVAALRAQYDAMMHQFGSNNLDVGAIRQMGPLFLLGDMTWPRQYYQMAPPYAEHCVRLLVVPLAGAPTLCARAAAATARIAALLPAGTQVFSNARAQYHCTLFHTSHPSDTRPDPFAADGGLAGLEGTLPALRPGATAAMLERETQVVQEVVQASPPLQLEVHSLVMTHTGTLLLTWVDHSGHVAALRHALRQAFPGATSKQATIIHTSLLRILTPAPLPDDVVAAINATCAELSQALRGTRFTPDSLWWINEVEYSTVVGLRQIIPVAC